MILSAAAVGFAVRRLVGSALPAVDGVVVAASAGQLYSRVGLVLQRQPAPSLRPPSSQLALPQLGRQDQVSTLLIEHPFAAPTTNSMQVEPVGDPLCRSAPSIAPSA